MPSPYGKPTLSRLANADKIDDYVKGVKAPRWMLALVIVLLALSIISAIAYCIVHAAELSEVVQSSSAKFLLGLFVR